MSTNAKDTVVIGVLALQGAFHEHINMFSHLGSGTLPKNIRIDPRPVRTSEELAQCDALVLPGGESSTIALIARRTNLMDQLKEFARDPDKAIWGTCAGMILLADEIVEGSAKTGGQESIGSLPIRVVRNQWGRQTESFEADLQLESLRDSQRPFRCVFIRAPVVHTILPRKCEDAVQVIATVSPSLLPSKPGTLPLGPDADVVALRHGRKMVTSFHPELTSDTRFHEYFIRYCVLDLA